MKRKEERYLLFLNIIRLYQKGWKCIITIMRKSTYSYNFNSNFSFGLNFAPFTSAALIVRNRNSCVERLLTFLFRSNVIASNYNNYSYM